MPPNLLYFSLMIILQIKFKSKVPYKTSGKPYFTRLNPILTLQPVYEDINPTVQPVFSRDRDAFFSITSLSLLEST